jgi:hypothetical protein
VGEWARIVCRSPSTRATLRQFRTSSAVKRALDHLNLELGPEPDEALSMRLIVTRRSDAMITSIGAVETIRCDGEPTLEAVQDTDVVIIATGKPLTGVVLWPSVRCVRGEVPIDGLRLDERA